MIGIWKQNLGAMVTARKMTLRNQRVCFTKKYIKKLEKNYVKLIKIKQKEHQNKALKTAFRDWIKLSNNLKILV